MRLIVLVLTATLAAPPAGPVPLACDFSAQVSCRQLAAGEKDPNAGLWYSLEEEKAMIADWSRAVAERDADRKKLAERQSDATGYVIAGGLGVALGFVGGLYLAAKLSK